jgi:hypothetical protein
MVQLPAYLQNRNAPAIAEQTLGHLGTASPPYVSIAGNRLTLIDASGDEEAITTVDPKTGIAYLDCAVIDAGPHESKIYFGRPYDPNATSWEPPKCWSDNGVAPSMNAGEPQARSCMPDPTGQHGCKWAVWGSATSKVSGKGVPACGKYQKLALAIPGDDVVFLIRVPPNSLENLRVYLSKFRGSGVDVTDVITRISFEPGGIGTLTFIAPGQWISPEMAAFRGKVLSAKGTDALVGRLDKPIANLLGQESSQRPLAPAADAQSAGFPSITTAPAPTQGALPAQAASPSSPPQASNGEAPAPRRRGRPKAEPQPAGTVAPFAQNPEGGQAGTFGIAQPQAPDAQMEADLKSVFG